MLFFLEKWGNEYFWTNGEMSFWWNCRDWDNLSFRLSNRSCFVLFAIHHRHSILQFSIKVGKVKMFWKIQVWWTPFRELKKKQLHRFYEEDNAMQETFFNIFLDILNFWILFWVYSVNIFFKKNFFGSFFDIFPK